MSKIQFAIPGETAEWLNATIEDLMELDPGPLTLEGKILRSLSRVLAEYEEELIATDYHD